MSAPRSLDGASPPARQQPGEVEDGCHREAGVVRSRAAGSEKIGLDFEFEALTQFLSRNAPGRGGKRWPPAPGGFPPIDPETHHADRFFQNWSARLTQGRAAARRLNSSRV